MFKKENLRKNFLRVKQIADQNLGRAEKSEVLSDDLQSSEKRVDLVKHVCQNTVKKLQGSLQATGPDVEKRLKKMPEAVLGLSMIESGNILGQDLVMGQMFQMCGECQSTLAQSHLQYEIDVETNVLNPMQEILEGDIPQIAKLKKQLSKVTLDMDSAKSRWTNAVRQTQVPGVNMASASSKADTVKEEFEEASNRVDQAKDAMTTGMFNFIAKEADHSQNLVALLEAQASYHKKALEVIEKMLPKMRETLSCNPTKPVYGVALEEHLRVANRDIATVLESCICYLLEAGLDEEGLFRIAGMASKVKKLKASFDAGIEFEDNGEIDPHTVAGALKQYLRELPEPLLTFQLYQDFVSAVQQPQDKRLQELWCVVDRLPKPNYDNFRYLVKFLAKLTEKSDVNKMSPSNIAIVIGPNLIWSEGDSGPNMMNTGMLSLITELIVQHADWFFPGALDFHMTQRGTAPPHRVVRQAEEQVESSYSLAHQGTATNHAKASVAMATSSTPVGKVTSQSRQSSASSSDTNSNTGDRHSSRERERSVEDAEKYLTAEDISFGSSSRNSSPVLNKSHDTSDHAELERTSSGQSGSSQGTPVSSPVSQETASQLAPPSTPPTVSRSPSISPVSSNSNLAVHGAPLAEGEDLNPIVRRPTRKPAPPPPPERPYSVAVSATVKPGHQQAQYQTWPRQAEVPQLGEVNQLSASDKQRTLPQERPAIPERISSLPAHHSHPDRPKVPPPVAPTHQRSASTGNAYINPSIQSTAAAGEQGSPLQGEMDSPTNDSSSPQDKLSAYNSLNRQSISRPPRPMPPPPPPPENIVEQTHL